MPEGKLFRAAMLALAAHLIAGLAMLLILRHGLETNPDTAARILFLSEHRLAWTSAWLTWTLAAFTILHFYRAYAAFLGLKAVAGIAVLAVAGDLTAQLIEVAVLPGLGDASAFLLWHRRAVLLTGFGANGFYTLAAALLVWAGRRGEADWVNAAGAGVVVGGCALSAAALADSAEGMFWANVALVPMLLTWLAGVGFSSRPR